MAGLMCEVGYRKGPSRTGTGDTFGCISNSRSQSAVRYDLPSLSGRLVAAETGLDVSRSVAVVLNGRGTSAMGCPFCGCSSYAGRAWRFLVMLSPARSIEQ